MIREPGLFDFSNHFERLFQTGAPLEAMARHVDFGVFRPVLEAALGYGERPKGGCPPYDPVTMFKILVLASMHNPSDERMQFLIRDRFSWLSSCGRSDCGCDIDCCSAPEDDKRRERASQSG